MHIAITTDVAAAPDIVWPVIADVTRWSEWTASITSVELLDDGPFRVGSRAKVRQPGFPAVVWTVTDLVEGSSFTWEARTPGLRSTGTHAVRPVPAGSAVDTVAPATADAPVAPADSVDSVDSVATLGIRQEGAMAWLMKLLFAKKSRRFVQMEADGLRRHCEAIVAAR